MIEQHRAELGRLVVTNCYLVDKPASEDTDLPSKRKLLDTAHAVLSELGEPVPGQMSWETFDPNQVALAKTTRFQHGRHLLIAVYGDTTSTDMLAHSHNIRVKVADHETLKVMAARDLHEDVLEPLLATLGMRHLISATREKELAEVL